MSESSFISHFIELRKRILICLAVYSIVSLPLIIFSKALYEIISEHLLTQTPTAHLIAVDITSTFMTPIKLALTAGFFLVIPCILFHAWAFIAPALYEHEKKPIMALTLISLLLFYCGMGFAYFIVCPVALYFFSSIAPLTVEVMTDMSVYFSFISTMLISFGLAFQLPIFVCVLLLTNFVSVKTLKQKRAFMILGAFVVGMILTPPDVISQILMAIPLIALYELGLVLFKWIDKMKTSPISHDILP